MTDENGETLRSNEYSAFGQVTGSAMEMENEFDVGYTGSFYDSMTGLVYLNARFYSPELGVFLTEDTIAGQDDDVMTLNRYAYCTQNPINYTDRSGHWKRSDHVSMNTDAVVGSGGANATMLDCMENGAIWADQYFGYKKKRNSCELTDNAKNRLKIRELQGYLDEGRYDALAKEKVNEFMAPYHGRGWYNRFVAYLLGLALQFDKGYTIKNIALRNDEIYYQQINFDMLIHLGSLYENQGHNLSRKAYGYLIMGVACHLAEDVWAHTALVSASELDGSKKYFENYDKVRTLVQSQPICYGQLGYFKDDDFEKTFETLVVEAENASGERRRVAAKQAAIRLLKYFREGKIMYSGSKQLEGATSPTDTDRARLGKLECSKGTMDIYKYRHGISTASMPAFRVGTYSCMNCQNGSSDSCYRIFYSKLGGKPELGYMELFHAGSN